MYEEVQPAEVYFLILHYLSNGPCSAAAKLLEQEAIVKGLLPCRTDINGQEHNQPYEELKQRFQHIPASGLAEVLKRCLQLSKSESIPGASGLTSLLNFGDLSVFGRQPHPLPQKPRVPQWNRSPKSLVSLMPKLCLRQLGLNGLSSVRCTSFPSDHYVKQLQHHRTVRGHRYAVYCVTWDRYGRRIVTGSDDRVVKIWSAHTALLLASCRGHDGDITDLSVSCDNTMVASSSNDFTVRCWSLLDASIGHPISVLCGHTLPVTYVDFSPALPNAVLTSSTDGTCRIWHARKPGMPSIVLRPSPNFGPTRGITRAGTSNHVQHAQQPPAGASGVPLSHLQEQGSDGEQAAVEAPPQEAQALSALLVCSFSKDGTYVVAGSAECHTYVWFWDILSRSHTIKDHGRMMEVDWENGPWPEPTEVCKLSGHKNDVVMLQFSHAGDAIATGSKDGSVRIWRQMKRRGRKLNLWQIDLVLSCQPDEEAVRLARRRRRAPPNPSVNQVAWSHDDKLVVAAITDHTIHVFDALTGVLRNRLKAHTASVHVLECHPTNHSIAMSAGYDGNLLLWDIINGKKLRSFSSQDTCPLGQRWCDPIQLVDGHFSPDGTSLAVTDVAGQVHIFGCGNAEAMNRAMYDQFWSSESSPLLRDERHYVINAETQLPPHIRAPGDKLSDLMGNPYPEPYQSAFKEGRVLQLPTSAMPPCDSHLPSSLIHQPPTITAAAWQAQEEGGTEEDIQIAIQRATERAMRVDMQAVEEDAAARMITIEGTSQAEGVAGTSTDADGGEGLVAEEALAADGGELVDGQDVEGGGDDALTVAAVRQSRRVRQMALAAAAERVENHRTSRRLRHLEPEVNVPVVARRRPHNRAVHSSEDEEDSSDGEGDSGATEDSVGSEGAAPADDGTTHRRRAGRGSGLHIHDGAEGGASSRQGVRRSRSGAQGGRASKRQRLDPAALDSDDDLGLSSSLEEDVEEEPSGVAYWEDGSEEEFGSVRRSRRRSAARGRDDTRRKAKKKDKRKRGGSGRQRSYGPTSGRPIEKYKWLQATTFCLGVYVPQMGDSVVYLRHGHSLYLENTHDKRRPPWEQLAGQRRGASVEMRPAEPCTVVGLHYLEMDDGQQNTVARLTLQLCDDASPLCGREFSVEIPPPSYGHADFVISRARYESSVHRSFKVGDRCQVYYPDDAEEGGEGGKWWTGTVSQDTCRVGPRRLAEDMWGHNDMWDRYLVAWDNSDTGVDGAGPSSSANDNCDSISPWEMYDEGFTAELAASEQPRLDGTLNSRMLEAVCEALEDRRYHLFHHTLPPDTWYPFNSGDVAGVFYNMEIPLPFALDSIRNRLMHEYYRQPAALEHDIDLIRLNAARFTGGTSPTTRTAEALQEYLISFMEVSQPDGVTEDVSDGEEGMGDDAAVPWTQGDLGDEEAAQQQAGGSQPYEEDGREGVPVEGEEVTGEDQVPSPPQDAAFNLHTLANLARDVEDEDAGEHIATQPHTSQYNHHHQQPDQPSTSHYLRTRTRNHPQVAEEHRPRANHRLQRTRHQQETDIEPTDTTQHHTRRNRQHQQQIEEASDVHNLRRNRHQPQQVDDASHHLRRSSRQHTHVNYRELEAMAELEEAIQSQRHARVRSNTLSRVRSRTEPEQPSAHHAEEFNPNVRRSARHASVSRAASADEWPAAREVRDQPRSRVTRATAQLGAPSRPRRSTRPSTVCYVDNSSSDPDGSSLWEDDFEEAPARRISQRTRSVPGAASRGRTRGNNGSHHNHAQSTGGGRVRVRLSRFGSAVVSEEQAECDAEDQEEEDVAKRQDQEDVEVDHPARELWGYDDEDNDEQYEGGEDVVDNQYHQGPVESWQYSEEDDGGISGSALHQQESESFGEDYEGGEAGPSDVGGLPIRLRRLTVKLNSRAR